MKQRASLMALALLLGITACSQSGKPASNDTTLGGALTPQVVQKNDGEAYMPIVMTFPSSTGGNNANYYGSSAVRGTDGYMYFDLAGNPQDGGTYTTTLVRVGNDRSSTFFDETCCISGDVALHTNIVADTQGGIWYAQGNELFDYVGMQLHHRYTVPLPSGGVIEASAIGSDGNIWIAYGNNDNSQVAGAIKVTPQGASTVYPLQPPNGATWVTTLSIVSGPDGALWLSGSASTGAFLFRVTTVGQETAAYPIPAQTTFVSANNALWGLNNDSAHGHLYVVQVSTSGAVTNYLQPESASCPYCEFNVVTGGAGKLWYSGYYGIYAFDFKTHSTSGPITTNLETTRASTAGAFGSDGNLWAAAGPTDLGASTAAVILMHVLTANVKSLSVAAGTSSSFSSTETGSCTSLSATSSNPSVATVTKDSGSCGGASFTVHGIKTGSATVTVTDNDTYYKSNRITIPVTVK